MKHKIKVSKITETWDEVEIDFPVYIKDTNDFERDCTSYYKIDESGKLEQRISLTKNCAGKVVSLDISPKYARGGILQSAIKKQWGLSFIKKEDWEKVVKSVKTITEDLL